MSMMNEQLEMNFNKMVVNNELTIEHLAFGGGGLVAKVYVDKQLSIQEQLEKAFMLTQNIVDGWWNNDDVDKITTKDAVRSTSVGDKIHINDTSYWVDMVGFKEDK